MKQFPWEGKTVYVCVWEEEGEKGESERIRWKEGSLCLFSVHCLFKALSLQEMDSPPPPVQGKEYAIASGMINCRCQVLIEGVEHWLLILFIYQFWCKIFKYWESFSLSDSDVKSPLTLKQKPLAEQFLNYFIKQDIMPCSSGELKNMDQILTPT